MPENVLAEARELRRVATVGALGVMDDKSSQAAYDSIAHMAQRIFDADVVLITFIDGHRQSFRSHIGAKKSEVRSAEAFCEQTLRQGTTLVVEDATEDQRFSTNSFVTESAFIRFYAGEPIRTHDGHIIGTICILSHIVRAFVDDDRDILRALADLVMKQVLLDRDITYRDASTNLPNRIQFLADMRAQSYLSPSQTHCPVVIELVGLEESNEAIRALGLAYLYDQFMHAVAVLREALGERTIYHVGPTHVAFYMSGERDVTDVLNELTRLLTAPFVTMGGIPAKLDPGCGVRKVSSAELRSADLMRTLFLAAYEARNNRTGVALYDLASDQSHKRSFSLLMQLPRALREKELFLVYQPRIDAKTNRWVGVEALLRWLHPTLGILSPGEFLPLITRTALAEDVTDWVMRSVCVQLGEWQRRGLPIRCSFNISAVNLEETDFVSRLSDLITENAITADALEIELVEDVSLMTDNTILARLSAVRDLGVTVAIDDFGSGYSNLAYLLEIPASVLKLDRSIIAGILTKPSYAIAVASIIGMGHRLGYRIVAEGVETEEQKLKLQGWDCDEFQGFLFAKPLEAAEIEKHFSPPDDAMFGNGAALLDELANVNRLQILRLLVEQGEISVGRLAALLGLSGSALSQHLARLKKAGLVLSRRDGQVVYYSSCHVGVKKILASLDELYSSVDPKNVS